MNRNLPFGHVAKSSLLEKSARSFFVDVNDQLVRLVTMEFVLPLFELPLLLLRPSMRCFWWRLGDLLVAAVLFRTLVTLELAVVDVTETRLFLTVVIELNVEKILSVLFDCWLLDAFNFELFNDVNPFDSSEIDRKSWTFHYSVDNRKKNKKKKLFLMFFDKKCVSKIRIRKKIKKKQPVENI